jgi:hypothetical protein
MKRRIALSIFLSLFILSFACSSTKTPEVSLDSSKSVLGVLRAMKQSYESMNLDAFLSYVSDAFPGRTAFAKNLGGVFSRYSTINFTINYAKLIVIVDKDGTVKPTFTWDAAWVGANGSVVKDGGRVTLVFDAAGTSLVAIEGRNPFLAQPAEAPSGK